MLIDCSLFLSMNQIAAAAYLYMWCSSWKHSFVTKNFHQHFYFDPNEFLLLQTEKFEATTLSYSRDLKIIKFMTQRFISAQKMKFFIKNFFSFLGIWSRLLKKSFMENFIFCAAQDTFDTRETMHGIQYYYCRNNFRNYGD